MNTNKILKKILHYITLFISAFKYKRIVPIITVKESDNLLEGKVALITGGSGGIGYAIAKKLLESGCKVIISGTNEQKLKEKAQELGIASTIVIDMTNIGLMNTKMHEAVNIFGRLDYLICSAGVHVKRTGFNMLNVSENEYDYIMNINLKGTYFICQAFANYLIKQKQSGRILLISSSRGAEPAWSPYSLSKHAITALTKGLAQVLIEHNIIVNAIAPGATATTMQDDLIKDSIYSSDNALGRYTTPDEIAECVKFLISDLGCSIIGDTIYMSGGRGVFDIR